MDWFFREKVIAGILGDRIIVCAFPEFGYEVYVFDVVTVVFDR